MNTVGQVFDELVMELGTMYESKEASNIMRLVFEEKLKMNKMDLVMRKTNAINDKERKLIFEAAEKLLSGQPVQQIIGKVHFLDFKLRINKNVLIPRPETEELVSLITNENTLLEPFILDIGTGSGCIAIALANKIEESTVTALDISQQALELARINAIANNAYIDFQNFDVLKEEEWRKLKEQDIIVSNPPYVLEKEKAKMHANVLQHEPSIALFVPDNDPLLFYKKITDLATKKLVKGGKLYFEINEAFGKQVKNLLETHGFEDVQVRKDLHNKDRFVRGILK